MKLHELSNTPGSKKRAKRLGRGEASGLGKTAGKGTKGQMSRKGHKRKIGFEGGQMILVRRLPKRGFQNPARVSYTPVNFDVLNQFPEGATVNAAELLAKGAMNRFANGGFKVLAKGELKVKGLQVKANAVSAAAKAKIEELGGSVEIVK